MQKLNPAIVMADSAADPPGETAATATTVGSLPVGGSEGGPSPSGGKFCVVELCDLSEGLLADWRDLEPFPHNSPHQSLAWCQTWCAAHGGSLLIVRGRTLDRTVFLLPLSVSSRLGLRIAQFPGGRYNNLNTGLFAQEFQPGAEEQRHVASGLREVLKGRVDLVALEAMPRVWRGRRHALSDLAGHEHANHSFQLPLLSSFEQTLAQVNAKRRRKKFRLQTRRMEEIGGYHYVTPADHAESHALLDLFFRQKAARFRAQGLPDVFAEAAVRQFFHGLLDGWPSGLDHPLMLRAIRLKAGDEDLVPAIAGLTRKGDHIICQFGSIDETIVPETSPGELLFWHMIEEGCRSEAALFDFGVGDQLYKRSWCPVETVLYDVVVPISRLGAMASLGHSAVTQAKARIKRHPLAYRLVQRLRSKRQTASETAD